MITTTQVSVVAGAPAILIATGSRSTVVTATSGGPLVYLGGDVNVTDVDGFLLQNPDATVTLELGQGDSLYAFRPLSAGTNAIVYTLVTS